MIEKITSLVPSINLPTLPTLNNINLSQPISVYMVNSAQADIISNHPDFSIEYLSKINTLDLISKVQTSVYYVPVNILPISPSYSISSVSNISTLTILSKEKHDYVVSTFPQIESNNLIIENYLDILSALDPISYITQLPFYESLINVIILDNNSLLTNITNSMDIFIEDPFTILSKKIQSINDFAEIDNSFDNTTINSKIAIINNFFT